MADTSVTYVGDGFETNYSVPFPYLDKSHVKVYINLVERATPLDFLWLDTATIAFNSAVAINDGIEIRRVTPGDTTLVNYQNGAVLTGEDLNTSMLQNFYLAQEAKEWYADLLYAEQLRIATSLGIVETDPSEILAALVTLALNDAAAATLQQRITDIDDNGEAVLALGANLQTQLTALANSTAATVYVQPGEPVPGVAGIPDPIQEGARWYDSDDNNHPYVYDQTGTQWIDLSDPRVAANESDIVVLEATVNDGVSGVAATAAALVVTDATALALNGVVTAQASSITTLQTDVGDNAAAVITEASARSTADGATAALIALIGVENLASTAFILDSATVKIDSDTGDTFATRLSGLAAADSNNSAAISAEETARIAADAAEAVLRVALAAALTTAEGDIVTNAAAVVSESTARVNAVGAVASDLVALDARVVTAEGDISSAGITISANVSAIANAETGITDLEARYGVALDVNGYISGFSLNNSGTVSSFNIIADQFLMVEGALPGETPKQVFAISGGVVTMQNAVINGNLIVNGTILAAHILADQISSTHILDNAIGSEHIADGSITTQLVDTGAITAALLAAGSVQAAAIQADAVSTVHIGDNQITSPLIVANAIGAAHIQANSITANEIAANTIVAGNIAALTIEAGQIAANAINAGHINVVNLAAVSAEFGSVTMTAAGHLKGGQTAFDTGTGFFLGYEASKYKFSIGNAGDNKMTWDGTTLTVKGNLKVGDYAAGEQYVLAKALTARDSVNSTSFTRRKDFTLPKDGVVTLKYFAYLLDSGSPYTAGVVEVRANGTKITSWNHTNTAQQEFTRTVTLPDDTTDLEVWIKGGFYDISASNQPTNLRIRDVYVYTDSLFGEKATLD